MSLYYVEGILIQSCYVLIIVLGLSVLTGFTGLFSFGHAGFVAIGAYISVICTTKGVPFPLAILAGGTSAMAIGALLGTFTLKLKGDYFCIVTLGFGEAVRLIFENIQALGGARGIANVPLHTSLINVLLTAALLVTFTAFLINSRHGRNLIALREEELAAQMTGINVFKYKMLALCISALYAGIGGAFLAHYAGYIQPAMFQMVKSTEYTIIVIFGGLGSITGSVIGTFILTALPEVLREADKWRLVVYGLAVIVIMITRPKGLMGGKELSLKSIINFFKRLFSGRRSSKEAIKEGFKEGQQ